MPRYKARNLRWVDVLGRFEEYPSSTHLINALGLLERLRDEGRSFWDKDSDQLEKWQQYSSELLQFLNTLNRRRDVDGQPLETAMREFIQEFEHSTLRMHQMLYGPVADLDNDEHTKHVTNLFNLVYLSSTYALLSAWIEDKRDNNSLTTMVDLTSGEIRQEGTRTEMRVPRKFRRSTKRI